MQLKTLQIQGFKSFPDKTTLHFDQGITAVVGPNGSGKSNISDAMGWVMGEQSVRSLRGEKMEDVIFLGTDHRKATGFAFVSLTFDNRDRTLPIQTDEVTISRKLYRSGESEYRINQAAVRLRDINELLMDTGLGRDGYSIIGQGRIDEIVSVKSTQRREIFEEAAGISKYRYRKEEAQKKLEAAYENLLRLKDIMAELEERIEPLRIQSEKAQNFLRLSEEKKVLEISLWMDSINHLMEQIEGMDAQTVAAKNKLQDIEALMQEHSVRLEEFYTQLQKCTIEIEANRSRSSSLSQLLSQLDSAIAVLENDMLHNASSIEELKKEMERFGQNQDALLDAIRKNKEEAAAGQKRLILAAKEKEELQQKEAEISLQARQAGEMVALLKSKRNSCEQDIALQKLNRASSSTLLEETRQRLEAAEQSQKSREDQRESLKKEHENCRGLLEAIEEKQNHLSNSKKGYELKKDNRLQQMERLLEQHRGLEQESQNRLHQVKILEDMERSMEGFQNSVKKIMNCSRSHRLSGIHGPISQLITVDSAYALAIETALGGSMQSIVVEDEESAKDAISYLKYNQGGRATFLPMTTIRPQHLQQSGFERENGFIGLAADLVKTQERYRSIIENLLGRIVVAESIDDAVLIARKNGYKFRIVTLDGQLVNAGGSLTGGSSVKNAGLLSRRGEIERLQGEADSIRGQYNALDPQIEQIKQELSKLDAELSSLNAQIKTAQEDNITYRAEEKRLCAALADLQKTQQAQQQEYETVKKRLLEVEQTSRCADDVIRRASQELSEISAKLDKEKERQDALLKEKQSLQEQINEKRFLLLSLTKDQESLSESAQRMKLSQDQQESHISELKLKISQFEDKNAQSSLTKEQKIEETAKTKEEITQTAQRIESLFAQQQQLEQTLTQMRVQDKEYISQKERASAESQRLEDKKLSLHIERDKLIARLWDDYSMTRSQASELAQKVEDDIPIKARLSELKNQIRELGVINVGAIEEYEDVFQRHQFLKKQMTDIEHSRTELIHLIHDLTAQMQELFLSNFHEIGKHFSDIFAQLFGGGRGELVLTDPDDVLSSGIDIRVQPPGKIIKTLSSLSGGEKALIAISIYFAILRVKPSPFCILDEIEAALDEVNVGRYARFLRSLTDKTQFISITHRRGTMEEADVMYGVTMQEKGVSRLLELDITKMEQELGLKTV